MQTLDVPSSGKARKAFPELVPQSELDGGPSVSFLNKWLHGYGYRKASGQKDGKIHVEPDLDVTTTILSVTNIHRFGDLFVKHLKARRDVFIVQKGWQLPETDGMEFDQYDTPLARWIVVHDRGTVLAGVRIAPTTAVCGNHSYMLRDAQLGLLPGLPFDMLYEEAPVNDETWEATRLFVTEAVPAKKRAEVQHILMKGMAAAAQSVGATQVIGIVPAVFRRWLKRIGMKAVAVGPVMEVDGDRVQAALMAV